MGSLVALSISPRYFTPISHLFTGEDPPLGIIFAHALVAPPLPRESAGRPSLPMHPLGVWVSSLY